MTHRDVNLGFFKSRKREVLALRAGQPLRLEDNFLYGFHSDVPVAQLSQKMLADLSLWAEKGYKPVSAVIRFVVAWRPKGAPKEEKEHAVLLVDLMLQNSPCRDI